MFLAMIFGVAAGDLRDCTPVDLGKKVFALSSITDAAEVTAGIADAEARLPCSVAYVDPTRLARLHLVGAISGGIEARAHLVRVFTLFPDEHLSDAERDKVGTALLEAARKEAQDLGTVELRASAPIRVDGIPLREGERRTFGAGAHIVQWENEQHELAGRWETFAPATRWAVSSTSSAQLRGRPGAQRRLAVGLGVSGAALTLAGAGTMLAGAVLLHDHANSYAVDDSFNQQLRGMEWGGATGVVIGATLMLVPLTLSGTFE